MMMPKPKAALVVVSPSTDLAQQWATRITRLCGEGMAKWIQVGAELIAAKKPLDHGGWGRMFKGHPQQVAAPLPLSRATAFRLMSIAQHGVLSNVAHAQQLPPSWTTLGELASLDESLVSRALADGRIHPEMKRTEATQLRQGSSSRKQKPAPWTLEAALSRLARALERELRHARGKDRWRIGEFLRQQAHFLKQPQDEV
jgi:hypothetical protein